MDKALKFTTTFYPKVLPAHEGVHFRLRCRKFIEMVRRASEMSEDAEAARASSSPAAAKKHNGFAGLTNPIPSHKMDMDLDQGVSLTEAPADDDEEEEEEDEEEEDEEDDDDYAPGGGGSHVVALSALEQDILLYGRSLQADYGHHQERGGSGSGGNTFATGLEQIWALMAYKKPLREPSVAHLFDQQGRAEVAEELNSAILCRFQSFSSALPAPLPFPFSFPFFP